MTRLYPLLFLAAFALIHPPSSTNANILNSLTRSSATFSEASYNGLIHKRDERCDTCQTDQGNDIIDVETEDDQDEDKEEDDNTGDEDDSDTEEDENKGDENDNEDGESDDDDDDDDSDDDD
jgi:hypothetical protein